MDKPRGFYPLTVSSTLARRAKCFIKMNYKKIYNNIINRAKTRVADSDTYYERHHIVPRCLNGTDDKENLVLLTGSEHRTAHLCLVKMYPDHHGLVKAAMMMDVCASKTHKRSKSKQYTWLKKLHQEVMSVSQTGENNSQFGTFSEMISANALRYRSEKTFKMLTKSPLETPYIVQIAGSDLESSKRMMHFLILQVSMKLNVMTSHKTSVHSAV